MYIVHVPMKNRIYFDKRHIEFKSDSTGLGTMFLNTTNDANKKNLKKISRVRIFWAQLKAVLLLVNIFFTDLNCYRSNLCLDQIFKSDLFLDPRSSYNSGIFPYQLNRSLSRHSPLVVGIWWMKIALQSERYWTITVLLCHDQSENVLWIS